MVSLNVYVFQTDELFLLDQFYCHHDEFVPNYSTYYHLAEQIWLNKKKCIQCSEGWFTEKLFLSLRHFFVITLFLNKWGNSVWNVFHEYEWIALISYVKITLLPRLICNANRASPSWGRKGLFFSASGRVCDAQTVIGDAYAGGTCITRRVCAREPKKREKRERVGGARGEHVFWAASPAALDRWGDAGGRQRTNKRVGGAEQLSSLAALLWSVSAVLVRVCSDWRVSSSTLERVSSLARLSVVAAGLFRPGPCKPHSAPRCPRDHLSLVCGSHLVQWVSSSSAGARVSVSTPACRIGFASFDLQHQVI